MTFAWQGQSILKKGMSYFLTLAVSSSLVSVAIMGMLLESVRVIIGRCDDLACDATGSKTLDIHLRIERCWRLPKALVLLSVLLIHRSDCIMVCAIPWSLDCPCTRENFSLHVKVEKWILENGFVELQAMAGEALVTGGDAGARRVLERRFRE